MGKNSQQKNVASASRASSKQLTSPPVSKPSLRDNPSDRPASQPSLSRGGRTRNSVPTTPVQSNTRPSSSHQTRNLSPPQPQFNNVPNEVEATNRSTVDVTSAITSHDHIENSVIISLTKYNVFPKMKFFVKVSEDPTMQWSSDPQSLCQYVLNGCNIKFDEKTTKKQKLQHWYGIRKVVADKIVSLRNDKSSAVRNAFYGKLFAMFFVMLKSYLTIYKTIWKKQLTIVTVELSLKSIKFFVQMRRSILTLFYAMLN
jgi:hypothetical protein